MKKLDKKKNFVLVRIRNRRRRRWETRHKTGLRGLRLASKAGLRQSHRVTAWFGGGKVEEVISQNSPRIPPEVICFDQNLDASVEFFDQMRNKFRALVPRNLGKNFSWTKPQRTPNAITRIDSYVDFTKTEHISTAAAVVLAAEYDRMSILLSSAPPTINLGEWHPTFFKKLYEVGFFDIVGLTENIVDLYRTEGDVRAMRILSGKNANELEIACKSIEVLSGFIDGDGALLDGVSIALNSALSEAMINVERHAYDHGHEFKYNHVQKWWIAAAADRRSRALTIVIYDQGATIPVTFPNKSFSDSVKSFFANQLDPVPKFDYQNDGVYIEGALKPGKTQTNQRHHGLGLPEMQELIDICGDGSITILSRGGVYRYDANGTVKSQSKHVSIGGTLVEWTLRWPEGPRDE